MGMGALEEAGLGWVSGWLDRLRRRSAGKKHPANLPPASLVPCPLATASGSQVVVTVLTVVTAKPSRARLARRSEVNLKHQFMPEH